MERNNLSSSSCIKRLHWAFGISLFTIQNGKGKLVQFVDWQNLEHHYITKNAKCSRKQVHQSQFTSYTRPTFFISLNYYIYHKKTEKAAAIPFS